MLEVTRKENTLWTKIIMKFCGVSRKGPCVRSQRMSGSIHVASLPTHKATALILSLIPRPQSCSSSLKNYTCALECLKLSSPLRLFTPFPALYIFAFISPNFIESHLRIFLFLSTAYLFVCCSPIPWLTLRNKHWIKATMAPQFLQNHDPTTATAEAADAAVAAAS